MLKRFVCLMTVLLLALPLLPARAETSEDGILTLDELTAWAEGYKARALASQPLNDPAAPESLTDDGYQFIYDFATLYLDSPTLTEDSTLEAVVVVSAGESGPRGTRVDDPAELVLDAFYTENPDLVGTRDRATLYAFDMLPEGGYVGTLYRDGQRMQIIEYAVYEQLAAGGDGYTSAGVTYTLQDNNVTAIRAYGLDSVFQAEDVEAALASARETAQTAVYSRVPMSYAGTDLTPFDTEDMIFAGLDFTALTPEQAEAALGEAREDVWLEEGEEIMRVMQFPSCELTFRCDASRSAVRLEEMRIDTDLIEGPRSVRVGDTLASVINRFRHGEGAGDETREWFYGSADADSYGMAEYGDDASAVLRYAAPVEGEGQVVLYLDFQAFYLSEILLYWND